MKYRATVEDYVEMEEDFEEFEEGKFSIVINNFFYFPKFYMYITVLLITF